MFLLYPVVSEQLAEELHEHAFDDGEFRHLFLPNRVRLRACVVRLENKIIGWSGFLVPNTINPVGRVGTYIDKPYRKKGFAREATHTLLARMRVENILCRAVTHDRDMPWRKFITEALEAHGFKSAHIKGR